MTEYNAQPWGWESLLSLTPPPRDPLADAVRTVLTVTHQEQLELPGDDQRGPVRRWHGTLKVTAHEARRLLTPTFAAHHHTPILQHGETPHQVLLTAVPGVAQPAQSRLWLAVLLFLLTIASTISVGGQTVAGFSWTEGLLFGGTLIAILLAHELGHFLASRHFGVAVSYPFFIPMPFSVFGTLGAVIQMKEPPPDRGTLFAIGVAGPLAGLALAIPLTAIGLMLSTVAPLPTEVSYILEGNNLLYGTLKWLIFGRWLPGGGEDVLLHPVAFAGWTGLLVTALNLLPAGQLDGGHVVFGLLGRTRGRWVSWGVIVLLLGFGFLWSGWWLWAGMIFLLARQHAPILDEITPLTRRQKAVGVLTLVMFILLFTPVPLVVVP